MSTGSLSPENSDMIGWTRKNNRAARAVRTLVHFFDISEMSEI